MLSEYQIECPKCGYLKASHHRELNSLATRIECPKCGLYKEFRLPRPDETVVFGLFDYAKRRVAIRCLIQWSRRLAAPIIYILYFHDEKLTVLLLGVFLMVQLSGPSLSIHKQLTYILRLMQFRHMMDDDLGAILSDDLLADDVLYNYELSVSAYGEEGIKRLDNRYYGYVRWLEASLRSLGCDEQMVLNEANRYSLILEKAVKERMVGNSRAKDQ